MRKLFLVLLTMLVVSLTANGLLYSETDTSTSPRKTVDEEWLLEDGTEGINIYPYEQGGWELYFPFDVIILSDSDGRYVFASLSWYEGEVLYWQGKYIDQLNVHNQDVKDYNGVVKEKNFWKTVATYGIPASIILSFIGGLLL